MTTPTPDSLVKRLTMLAPSMSPKLQTDVAVLRARLDGISQHLGYHFANEDGNRSQNNRWNRGHRSIRTF